MTFSAPAEVISAPAELLPGLSSQASAATARSPIKVRSISIKASKPTYFEWPKLIVVTTSRSSS
jgi:hypothetical protein